MDAVVLFDFDGVVADSFEAYFGTFTSVCAEMGFNRLNSTEAFLKLFEGNPIRQLFWMGFPVFRLKRLVLQFAPRIVEAHRHVQPFPAMPEIVTSIAQRYPTYVITTNTSDVVRDFLRRHNVEGVRDVLGVDVHPSKTKKVRRIVRDHPGVTTYFVTDTKGDLREARAAGAIPVAVTWGWHPETTLRSGRPDHVVTAPESLLDLFAR